MDATSAANIRKSRTMPPTHPPARFLVTSEPEIHKRNQSARRIDVI